MVAIKLTLLGITALFAIDARLRVIPATVVSVLFVVVGVSFQTGWFMR